MTARTHNPVAAFHWREQPTQINWRGKTVRQIQLDATRSNREAALCTFVPPEKAQRMRKASI